MSPLAKEHPDSAHFLHFIDLPHCHNRLSSNLSLKVDLHTGFAVLKLDIYLLFLE